MTTDWITDRITAMREDTLRLNALLSDPHPEDENWNFLLSEVTGRITGVSDSATLERARRLLTRFSHPSRLGSVPSEDMAANLAVTDAMLTWAARKAREAETGEPELPPSLDGPPPGIAELDGRRKGGRHAK